MANATIPFEMTAEIGSFLGAPVKKAEYVVSGAVNVEVVLKSGEVLHPQEIRERVTRCQDCASYRQGGAGHKPRCERSIGTFVPEPDGFCAWGEERER